MEQSEDMKEQLLQKQKKEKKELQGKIQGLKKTVTKGDKKKKKEVQEAIAKLEAELAQKHEAELAELKSEEKENEAEAAEAQAEAQAEEEGIVNSVENLNIRGGKKSGKMSKARKRRDKKAAEQRKRQRNIMDQIGEDDTGPRHSEIRKISEILKKEDLMIYEIEADGNCLYNAIDHQLRMRLGISYGAVQLRNAASKMMEANPSEYLPFLSTSDSEDFLTEEEYYDYCEKVAHTYDWGGQVELRALSQVLQRPIRVIQADGPILIMGEEYSNNENLVICYHRHMFELGEHFNSVQPLVAEEDSEEAP